MIVEKLQWHPAFSAALRIEFEENLDDLDFEDEYQLSKKPMQMDVLVIKKDKNVAIKKNIGHIFRTHNIIEYKSPDDTLNINDFYKVYGYTCFYQSDTEKVMEISPEEITITFVCGHYPRKLLKHLKDVRGIEAEQYGKGIYYLRGDAFPIQILVIPQLSKKTNYWLQNLRSDLKTGNEIRNIMEQYEAKKYSKYYQAVMDLIVRANWEAVREEKEVCEALKELFADELEESKNQGIQEGLEKGTQMKLIQQICKKLAKGKSPESIADDLEENIADITKICNIAKHYAPDYAIEKILGSYSEMIKSTNIEKN